MHSEITIAVIFHNEKEALPELLNSLKAASDSERCTLLLIDNASTDGSSDIAQSMVSMDFAEWKFFERKHNHVGEARAQAVSLARTEWVVFVDADCTVEKDWISTYLRMLPHLPEKVAALGSGSDVKKRSWVQRAVRAMTSTSIGTMGSGQIKERDESNPMARPTTHLPACNMAYRKQAVADAGNFSNDFDRACEDVELNIRLQKKGWRLVYLPGNWVTHGFTIGLNCWCQKMFRFGLNQWRVLAHHPEHLSIRMLSALVFLPALAFFLNQNSASTLAIYFALILIASMISLQKSRSTAALLPATALVFTATHLFFAAGSVVGFFEWLAQPFRKIRNHRESLRGTP